MITWSCKQKPRKAVTILRVPHIGYLCYFDADEILLQGSWLENKRLIYILLCDDFVKFSVLNQSEP